MEILKKTNSITNYMMQNTLKNKKIIIDIIENIFLIVLFKIKTSNVFWH